MHIILSGFFFCAPIVPLSSILRLLVPCMISEFLLLNQIFFFGIGLNEKPPGLIGDSSLFGK